MKKLLFWEDQLPSGRITQSSARLVFLIGWFFLFGLIALMVYRNQVDLGLIGLVASIVTGQKLYQKHLEPKKFDYPGEPKEFDQKQVQ